MKIVKETSRRMGAINKYRGMCDGCGTPLEYDDELIVVEIDASEGRAVVCPVDTLSCPNCFRQLATITLYASMDVTEEIMGLKQGK